MAKDDHGNVNGAEHGKLMRLLEKTALALEEGAMRSLADVSPVYRALCRSTYTERFRSSLMALISIFLRPMV